MNSAINSLNAAASLFIESANAAKLSASVYEDGWNAKEIISHIVFYHSYYASVVKAIVKNEELPLIYESLTKTNAISAKKYKNLPREKILNDFQKFNAELITYVSKLPASTQIPYTKYGTKYTPEEYITVIAKHVTKHAKDLKKAKKRV